MSCNGPLLGKCARTIPVFLFACLLVAVASFPIFLGGFVESSLSFHTLPRGIVIASDVDAIIARGCAHHIAMVDLCVPL